MKSFSNFKDFLRRTKRRLKDNDLESIMWLVNIFPDLGGFSILKDGVSVQFWIILLAFLIYIYGVGIVVYYMKFEMNTSAIVKSYVNISIVIYVLENSYWFLRRRSLLKIVLQQVTLSDTLARESVFLRRKYEKLMSVVKKYLLIFYGLNILNVLSLYVPVRGDVTTQHYSMAPCIGLDLLNTSLNREICHAILFVQEWFTSTVGISYQIVFLFLIAHTTAMYEMLSAEMLAFDEYEDTPESRILVKQHLPSLIRRHSLTLSLIKNLRALYSTSIGVNFVPNTVCICLFFCLPLQESLVFLPVLVYSFPIFFLYCFLCQRLINASELFENAVYGCGWEKFDIKEQKSVYLMLLQAQKPITLLAAHILPVNLHTFASTLQAMYKFITVVKF